MTYCEANANLNTGLTEKTLMDQFRNLKDIIIKELKDLLEMNQIKHVNVFHLFEF